MYRIIKKRYNGKNCQLLRNNCYFVHDEKQGTLQKQKTTHF